MPHFPLVPLIHQQGEALEMLLREHKINTEEFAKILEILGRKPTMAELGVFSSMWSEHCSYKSSKIHLEGLPSTGEKVVVGPGENAGVVEIEGDVCVAFKMESHNHPSFIEPYQGAATGVGGILRDVFCMGARPIANLNALRFGKREHPKVPYLFEHVVAGIGDYGNCVGVPTVGGNISHDSCYDGNNLVNAMTVGYIHKKKIFKGFASGKGNLVVYVGSATGRDGIHGATMASDSFESEDAKSKTTIQVGDPFMEKLLLEATLEVLAKNLVVGLQDMGAAGLTSSCFEMASRAGMGLELQLDQVPVRAQGMTAYELLLSESQERMLMVVEPKSWPELKEVLAKWQLSYAVIGTVTDSKRVQAFYQQKCEIDVAVDPLTDHAPVYDRPQSPVRRSQVDREKELAKDIVIKINEQGFQKTFEKLLRMTGSHDPIYNQFDYHIGTKSILTSEHHSAAVIWLNESLVQGQSPRLGVAISSACNEDYCFLDPRHGAAHAVVKCARMIVAAGGQPLAITDCLNYGNPEDPEVMWEFAQGVEGISEACRQLNIPVVSGNVSLYNETDGKSIKPTPMIGMVGKVPDITYSRPATINQEASLYLLTSKNPAAYFGGSLVAKSFDVSGGQIPLIDYEVERQAHKCLYDLLISNEIFAVRDVARGGIPVTLFKMIADSGLSFVGRELQKFKENIWHFGEFGPAFLIAGAPNLDHKLIQPLEMLKVGEIQRSKPQKFVIGERELAYSGLKESYTMSSIL